VAERTRLAKWGTSVGVRIPGRVLEAAHLREGDNVALEVEDGRIVIQPAPARPTLNDLVNGITPKHRHGETEWGKAEGKEVW
jgi:antitoxin MazE